MEAVLGVGRTAFEPALEDGASILDDLATRSLSDVVAEAAARRPDHAAVIDRNGTRRTSYRDLMRLVDRWAGRLATGGVTAGTPVGLAVGADLGAPLGFLSILAAGGVVVPFDAALPTERRTAMAEALGCPRDPFPRRPAGFRSRRRSGRHTATRG